MAPFRRFDIVPKFHSSSIALSQMKDSRGDGIRFERSNALFLQHLQKTSPTKSLADFSSPGLQKVYLDYSEPLEVESSEIFLQYLTTVPKSKDSIWEVEITDPMGIGNWSILAEFIKEVPSISTLKWALYFPIPAIVLEALELKHPNCRLHYTISHDTLDLHSITISSKELWTEKNIDLQKSAARREINSIINSTILYSFSTDMDSISSSATRSSVSEVDFVYQILTTCPGIRELDLNMNRCRKRCLNSHLGQPVALNLSDRGKPLPPLEVLSLKSYNFETDASGRPLMEWKTGPDKLRWPLNKISPPVIEFLGYPLIRSIGGLVEGDQYQSPVAWDKAEEETNLDLWLELMDWTHLRTLKIQHPSTQLRKLEGNVLPSLRHVSFSSGGRCCMQEIRSFLANVSALESLFLQDISYFSPDPIVSIISKHHCPTLESLRLDRTFLNSTHLSQLLHHCPRIHTLDINLDRTEKWDYGVLDTLVSFPELRSLTLRFDIRRMDEDEEEMDAHLGYSRAIDYDGYRHSLVDEDDEIMMLALQGFLNKRKMGTKFEKIRTLVGELDVPKAGISS